MSFAYAILVSLAIILLLPVLWGSRLTPKALTDGRLSRALKSENPPANHRCLQQPERG